MNEIDNIGEEESDANMFSSPLLSGIVEHIYFTVIDCVLPPVGRDYSSNVASCSITGKIRAVYDDFRYV
jgi:hypothetical protein